MNTLEHDRLRFTAGLRRAAMRLRRAAGWPTLAAMAMAAALMVAFVQVVLANVQNGLSRNRAVAERADAVWRCNALRSPSQRANCLAQLDAPLAASR
jgi:hypothetical protein